MLLQEGNYNSFPDQAFLDEVILLGMDGRGETGFLPEYSLKYFREARPEGVFLAFADTSYSETMMESVWQYGAAALRWDLAFVLRPFLVFCRVGGAAAGKGYGRLRRNLSPTRPMN